MGDLDPITANELPSLEDEVREAGLVRWGTYNYGNCAHSWTDPSSGAYREVRRTRALREERTFAYVCVGSRRGSVGYDGCGGNGAA